MWETVLGGLFGGIFRVIPEIMKYLDAKNERAHELKMSEKQIEFEQVKGAQRSAEITAEEQATWNTGALDTLKTSIETQFRPSGVKWVDALSTLIRPAITIQWVILLYPAVIIAGFFIAISHDQMSALQALKQVFGPEEKALVAAILNFWFLGRTFERIKSV
jgi:hypothetical protein